MNNNNSNTIINNMLSSSPGSSSSSSSANPAAAFWTIAALFGAYAAVTIWTKQQQQQQQQQQQRKNKNITDDERNNNRSRRRSKSSNSDGDASDAISVEGSVMVTLPTWAIASLNDQNNHPTTCIPCDTNNINNNNNSSMFSKRYRTDEEMMSLAIHLSDRNITEGTGGPFGAAIFERHPPAPSDPPDSGGYCTLVSVGMNRVVPLGNSTLHGEMVAIQLAQRKVGSFTLSLDEDGGDGSEHDREGLFYDESREEEGEEEREQEQQKTNGTANDDDAATAMAASSESKRDAKRKRQFELFTSCEPCCMCLGATLWSGVSRIVCGARKEDAQAIGFDEGPVYEASYKHLEECGVGVTRNVLREEAATVLRRYGSSGLIYNR